MWTVTTTRVHRQVVALSGACGLNTDDEVIEDLSPWALRGIILADQRNESGEIRIIMRCSQGTVLIIRLYVLTAKPWGV